MQRYYSRSSKPLADVRAVNNLAFDTFEAAHPDIAAWWKNSTFPFAVDLRNKLKQWGHLTPNQVAAAERCARRYVESLVATTKQVKLSSASKEVNVQFIIDAFERARVNGVRTPHLRLLGKDMKLDFSRAPDHGSNPGAIYVKSKGTNKYLGKILGGRFAKSSDCSESEQDAVLVACSNPEQAAIAYGRRFGSCSVCGRELTNHESIDLGIGPTCRERFFG